MRHRNVLHILHRAVRLYSLILFSCHVVVVAHCCYFEKRRLTCDVLLIFVVEDDEIVV